MNLEKQTDYGRLIVGGPEELYARAVGLAAEQFATRAGGKTFSWAFTGGSSPISWYRWCVAEHAIPEDILRDAHFTVSDERYVPLASDQSNFGNADRELFEPLGVPQKHRHPWPTSGQPAASADRYAEAWAASAGPGKAYDVCVVGMGDDAHTLSVFPGSPLVQNDGGRLFTAIDVPGKGMRLTLTPTAGLTACGRIIVMTSGAAKADAIRRVFNGPYEPKQNPIQLLRHHCDRVYWLIDEAAAAKL